MALKLSIIDLKRVLTVMAAIVFASSFLASAQTANGAEEFHFDSERWVVADHDARVMTYMGRQSLYLYRGFAYLRDFDFQDGTIECDFAFHGNPSFAGLLFRVQPDDDGELIYVRPHHSRQQDALQYTPIFADEEAWQLYNGPGYTATAEVPLNRWVHVKLEVKGDSASFYFDNLREPALVVPHLKRGLYHGSVGFWSRLGGANISNVRITKSAPVPVVSKEASDVPPGTVRHWRLSTVFDAAKVDPAKLPEMTNTSDWESVASEGGGLLNLRLHRKRVSPVALNPLKNGSDLVYASVILDSATAQTVRMDFGYSDKVHIFLNGRLLFRGDSAYLSRDPAFPGIIGLHDSIYLDLRQGRNEVVFAVTEQYGGWGVMARVDHAEGVVVP